MDEANLRQRYQPIVRQQLQSTGFYGQYQMLQTAVNQLPVSQRPNGLGGVHHQSKYRALTFIEIGERNWEIRRDPVGRWG